MTGSVSITGSLLVNGNVGVGGTASGTYGKLSVYGGLNTIDDNNSKLEIGRYSVGAPNSYIKLGANSNSLRFTNAGDLADIMILTNSGSVGIGTTNPTGKLMLYQSSAGNVLQNIVSNQGGSTQAGINFSPSMTDTEVAANPAQASIYATDSNYGANIIFANKATGSIGNALTERMRITAAGSVGIGTATPTGSLEISSANSGNTQMLLVRNYALSATGNFTGNYTAEVRGASNSNLQHTMLVHSNENNSARRILDVTSLAGTVASFLSDGNVGIGNTPSYKLDVYRGSSGVVLNLQGVDAYDAETGILFTSSRAKISGFLNSGGGTPGSSLRFYTMPDGGSVTERLRITSDGNVLIGRTTSGLTNSEGVTISGGSVQPESTGYVLYGNRTTTDGLFIGIRRNNVDVGSISVTTSATAFNTSSDYRLKTDFKEFNALSIIDSITTYDFAWKIDNTRAYGVKAHELQNILPYVVFGEKDEINEDDSIKPQAVDYSKLVPVLVKAIQELKAENDTLKDTLQRNNII
jgi:hypothetical protein